MPSPRKSTTKQSNVWVEVPPLSKGRKNPVPSDSEGEDNAQHPEVPKTPRKVYKKARKEPISAEIIDSSSDDVVATPSPQKTPAVRIKKEPVAPSSAASTKLKSPVNVKEMLTSPFKTDKQSSSSSPSKTVKKAMEDIIKDRKKLQKGDPITDSEDEEQQLKAPSRSLRSSPRKSAAEKAPAVSHEDVVPLSSEEEKPQKKKRRLVKLVENSSDEEPLASKSGVIPWSPSPPPPPKTAKGKGKARVLPEQDNNTPLSSLTIAAPVVKSPVKGKGKPAPEPEDDDSGPDVISHVPGDESDDDDLYRRTLPKKKDNVVPTANVMFSLTDCPTPLQCAAVPAENQMIFFEDPDNSYLTVGLPSLRKGSCKANTGKGRLAVYNLLVWKAVLKKRNVPEATMEMLDPALLFKVHGKYVSLPRANPYDSGMGLSTVAGKQVMSFLGTPIPFVAVGIADACRIVHGSNITMATGTSVIKSVGLQMLAVYYARANGVLTMMCGPNCQLQTWSSNLHYATSPRPYATSGSSSLASGGCLVDDDLGGAVASPSKPSSSQQAGPSSQPASLFKTGDDIIPIYDLTSGFDFAGDFDRLNDYPTLGHDMENGSLAMVCYYVVKRSYGEPCLYFNLDWAALLG